MNPGELESCERTIPDLLRLCRQGDAAATGELFRWSRRFLRAQAGRAIRPQLRLRVDESDLAQQVCLAAFKELDDFRGVSEAEYAQWLRVILSRDAQDIVRREQRAAKRTMDRETGGSGILRRTAASQSSPSYRAIRNEQRQQLHLAILRLPESQSEAVWLRHVEGHSLSEIAQQLGKTEDAVMGLLRRGSLKLAEILKE